MFLTKQGNKHWTNWTTKFLRHLRALHHIAHPAQNIVQSTALQLWTTRIMHPTVPVALTRQSSTKTMMSHSLNSTIPLEGGHKITKGMDAWASSYIMYRNVTKHLPAFFISILYQKVRLPVLSWIAEQWQYCTIGQKVQWQYCLIGQYGQLPVFGRIAENDNIQWLGSLNWHY